MQKQIVLGDILLEFGEGYMSRNNIIGQEKVLEHLSRYVFRIAITDRRIIDVKEGKVCFSWKDCRLGHFRKMGLETDGFIRRFLLHVVPSGLFKVRFYGIFSSRYRKENLTRIIR